MKRKLLLLVISIVLSFTLVGCEELNTEPVESVTVAHGTDALIKINNGLYYDAITRIAYWWSGTLGYSKYDTTPSPYYAPNGLPYKYNPELNTFEEIDITEYIKSLNIEQ